NGSGDMGWTGKGRDPANKFDRERWLTYRDGYCRQLFVERSPLYPLNSIMAHGIVYGRFFQGGDLAKNNPPDLKNEARSYFAIGSSLQELYLTPSLLTPQAWDAVAAAARWARRNADVLVDSHWVGGDPLQLQVYGYAAWSPHRGTLMLRNPDDRPQRIALDAQKVFELPAGAAKHYALRSPYADQRVQALSLTAGQPQTCALEPFEVLVFDARPAPVAAGGE
ncbi:MAG: enterotoxin, partial [Acidobacteriota bacterium]|nr:enterotoxin [Acidobacteriota bacterium]